MKFRLPEPTSKPRQQSGSVTIAYEYDPLYRLTEANYSTGDYYHYTYDAVGNRLSQTTELAVTSYQYDVANRLISVDGVNYTWDNNGNLLNDGVNSYTYDSANRLISLSNQSTVSTYQYNGLGDRLTQTVNGQQTNYTLDLNSGLTQVLNDGTNQYLYGLGRIAQVNTTTDYFLTDALGSVRQLADTSGEITLAKSYQPYGETLASAGSGTSPFAFTGEQQDTSGLTHLRARYYASDTGRFTTKDMWDGDISMPMSYNAWLYTYANPINFTDPSGHITEKEAADADKKVEELKAYNVKIGVDWGYRPIPYFSLLPENVQALYPTGCYWEDGNWRNLHELELTLQGVQAMATKLGGVDEFKSALAGMPISIWRMPSDFHSDGVSVAWTILDIKIYNKTFDYGDVFARGTVVHELAHVWDTRYARIFYLSSEMSKKTKSYRFICPSVWSITCPYEFDPNGLEDPPTEYGKSGEREDFADSFAICVYPTYKGASSLNLFPIRKNYIEGMINGNKCS